MTSEMSWRKSSYSGGSGGNCVELADRGGRVLVRDTSRLVPVLCWPSARRPGACSPAN